MTDVTLPRTPINQNALTERLRTVFGENKFAGISGVGEQWVFHFKGEVSAEDEITLNAEIAQHNPETLTDEQQRLADRAAAFQRLKAADLGAVETQLNNSKDTEAVKQVVGELLTILRDWQKLLDAPNDAR